MTTKKFDVFEVAPIAAALDRLVTRFPDDEIGLWTVWVPGSGMRYTAFMDRREIGNLPLYSATALKPDEAAEKLIAKVVEDRSMEGVRKARLNELEPELAKLRAEQGAA